MKNKTRVVRAGVRALIGGSKMRTIKRNIIELGPFDEIMITGNPDSVHIVGGEPDLTRLTKAALVKQLEEWPDDTEIVVTLPLFGGEQMAYYLTEEVGDGWKPSGVAELTLGAFASG